MLPALRLAEQPDHWSEIFDFIGRGTYRVNDNFRWEWTGSYGYQNGNWEDEVTAHFYTAEMAGVFTVNADYFGRPQIKPFVTYLYKDASDNSGWGDEYGSKKGGIPVRRRS